MVDKDGLKAHLIGFSLDRTEASSLSLTDTEVPTRRTVVDRVDIFGTDVPRYTNEFWTSRQRQASSIHEVSYRACFKPQLPAFFIDLLTEKGDVVYDPFSGRGTTVIEAGLRGRRVVANDINPLSRLMSYPRFFVPWVRSIEYFLAARIYPGSPAPPQGPLSAIMAASEECEG